MTQKLAIIFVATAIAIFCSDAVAETDTTFTYQAELTEHGSPAMGDYNMGFSLWDAELGGTAIGGFSLVVPVVDGKFSTELDFGGAAFDNTARWLEIEVNGVPLSPRTPITRAPYAIQTRGIFVNQDESYVGIGPTANTSNPTVVFGISRDTNSDFGGMIVETTGTGGLPFYAYSAGGSGAFHYVDGNTGNWHLVTNETFQPLLTATPDETLGIGTSIPEGKLSVFDNTEGTAVMAISEFEDESEFAFAVRGTSMATTGVGYGVFGATARGVGVLGQDISSEPGSFAGYFFGDVGVLGTLSKSAGSFKIDHPLDPENKYLSHSFVESPDMMNVYNGNIVTDSDGYATVELPEWFEVLNRDFRYQLTVIDIENSEAFVLAKVVEEIANNRFRIRSSVPKTKVSWQVTGVRQDPYAEANRIQVEQVKPEKLRGRYQHPEVYGFSAEFGEESIKLPPSRRGRQKQSTEVSQQIKRDR